ncbi:hypothetical protein [Ferruginibacter sp. HRS2-29]|uniref:hypothetical protein n=1 Tax=Ferruginibacter sp. HRS2-29 TaxID=2487334 RepID=UPI0020CC3D5D|nr:hypothetical protein [Ferruginibacter sp. HRS2-29]
MKKINIESLSFSEALKVGLDLSFKKLVKEKRYKNEVLAFSRNGKIVTVKARDIKLKK